MHSLRDIEKMIEQNPIVVRQYINTNNENKMYLGLISQAIINVFNRSGQNNIRHSLDECHEMAVSASNHLVQNLYFRILPELVLKRQENSLLDNYLKAWVTMFPGKWKYSKYPNFDVKYGQFVSKIQIPIYLKQSFNRFEKNIKNIQNQTVQFFQDSVESETQMNKSVASYYQGNLDIRLLNQIKQEIQSGKDTQNWIDILNDFLNRSKLADLNQIQTNRLNQQLKWIKLYLGKYQYIKNYDPQWQHHLAIYANQLINNNVPSNQKSIPNNNIRILEPKQITIYDIQNDKINSQRAINLPRKQQDFSEFRKTINKPSNFSKHYQSRSINQQSYIQSMNDESSFGGHQLVMKKHVPNIQQSPNNLRMSSSRRNKIFNQSNSDFRKDKGMNKSRNMANSHLNKSIKLSQFSQEKNGRKQTLYMDEQDLDQAPQWILSPYKQHFQDIKLFSRYRKTCLLNESMIFESQNLVLKCYKKRLSPVDLQLTIVYQNLSQLPIDVTMCYKIAQKVYEVQPHMKIKKHFALQDQQQHSFSLILKELPLKICSLELRFNQNQIQIPLPFTILNYVTHQPITKDYFLNSWNQYNKTNYAVSKKIHYNQKILNSREIQDIFTNMVDLGKTQNYSFEEWGCKCKFQYYNMEFLLIFAFNIDTYLTLELLSCNEVVTEKIDFLNYYLSVLMMLLQNRY